MDDLQPHIKLKKVDKICFLSGNPDRVSFIAKYLQGSEKVAEYRGLIAYKGKTQKKQIPVTVLTTGMGTGSSSIVLEEAHRAGGKIFIRIGSTGSLQSGDKIGTIYIPHGAIRDEGTSSQFMPIEFPATANPNLYQALCNSAKNQGISYKGGIVWTTDIYYQPDLNRFREWAKYGATCVEMESSVLFTFGSVKGNEVQVATILTSDGNLEDGNNIYVGNIEENYAQFQQGVENTIKCAIGAIDSEISQLILNY